MKTENEVNIRITHPNNRGIVTVFLCMKGLVSPGSYSINEHTLSSYLQEEYKHTRLYNKIMKGVYNMKIDNL
jgi:hypothetical protein